MSSGLPREIVNETDASYYVDTVQKGISCVVGITEKGPIGTPQLIGSEIQYGRIYGGELKTSDFPLLAKRALKYGAVLWVSRTAHYADITDKRTLTAKSAFVDVKNNAATPANVLRISASSPGAWGDKLQVKISENDIDPVNLFNVTVYESGTEVEQLEDMSMSEESEKYIENSGSAWLDFEITGTGLPKTGTYTLSGGADGTENMSDADYIGSATNSTGFHAFDDITDAIQLAAPGISSPAVITAGNAYCETRGDMVYISETPFGLTPTEAVDFRLGKEPYTHATFDCSYGAMYYPKIEIYDTVRQKERLVSPVGDVLGKMAVNDYAANESYAPAGTRRGKILNVLGIDVNVGGKGRADEGNYLCNNQINPLCSYYDTGVVIWGAQTLQRQASLLRELNVRRMLIVIKKAVGAYARAFIHQPNNPETWHEFYRGLDPKFKEWKAQNWFYDYRIFCDQNANTLEEAKLNIPESVQRGEFKCNIYIKPVVGIKWVLVNAVVTRLDANFDESIVDAVSVA